MSCQALCPTSFPKIGLLSMAQVEKRQKGLFISMEMLQKLNKVGAMWKCWESLHISFSHMPKNSNAVPQQLPGAANVNLSPLSFQHSILSTLNSDILYEGVIPKLVRVLFCITF